MVGTKVGGIEDDNFNGIRHKVFYLRLKVSANTNARDFV